MITSVRCWAPAARSVSLRVMGDGGFRVPLLANCGVATPYGFDGEPRIMVRRDGRGVAHMIRLRAGGQADVSTASTEACHGYTIPIQSAYFPS